MKSSPSTGRLKPQMNTDEHRSVFICVYLCSSVVSFILCWTIAVRAELQEWMQNVDAASRLNNVFFQSLPMPGGPIVAPRSPREMRASLTRLIQNAPSDAELFQMRARAAEQQLQFAAAEADWQKYAEVSGDKAGAQMALADFYHRRLRPLEELQTLSGVARLPSPQSERLLPAQQQRSWLAFERIFSLIQAHALPLAESMAQYQAWTSRYSGESGIYTRYFEFLLDRKQYAPAERLLEAYQKAFPDDAVFPVKARAGLERRRGSLERALAVYERSFRPLWPPELVKSYFDLLKQTRRLRAFLSQARASAASNPEDLAAAARIFYYYQQQGNLPAAERALAELRLRKEARKAAWNADELWTLGQLLEGIHSYDEASRHYYALYSLPGNDASAPEKALAGLIRLLLNAPDAPIRFGAGDLSFYRDVATMDPYPGFLNGVLSLLLNSESPSARYATQERASVAYFHRARAAELLALFDSRFPRSTERADLRAALLETYATYGDDDGVIREARAFLAAFPAAAQRTRVSLLMAEAHARKNQAREEFAAYDGLLKELASGANGLPLGSATGAATAPQDGTPRRRGRAARVAAAQFPQYALVLDRYIARLVLMKQIPQALDLYRREIDRNPNDPELYERLAAFLDQNRRGAEVEQVYRRAIGQFPDRSWYQKLARWYLRRQQAAEFERLAQEVVRIFSGTELEGYFREVVGQGNVDPILYRQVNLFAHQRFPHNLTFVRNLLAAYMRRETFDAAAWEQLLRNHWYHDEDLRSRFFEFLSRSGRLEAELQSVRSSDPAAGSGNWPGLVYSNPAATRFVAEAEAWRSHFEPAAPVLQALATEYPGDRELGQRAAAVHRSLAAYDPKHVPAAVSIEQNLQLRDPRDRGTVTRIGEIYADREMFARAGPQWERLARLEPGKSQGYLEAATVYWDYFRFDDALRVMAAGRKQFANPTLYAYEAGAVYENKREMRKAVEEYVRGARAAAGRSPARSRLLELARRPEHQALVEEVTAGLASGRSPRESAIALRVEILEAQNRMQELETLLLTLANSAGALEALEQVERLSEKYGFEGVREKSLEQQINLAGDPVDRMRLRLALARFHEGRGKTDLAQGVLEALYKDQPSVLGIVRATVDFYWRNKMPDLAVNLLVRAAGSSYPGLKKQFLFEAARKSTEARQYARARELLAPLLLEDPFNGEYLAALADTHARAGEDQALRDFYAAKIQEMRSAPLSAEDRTARIAALRRGLILALTRLKDYAAAVDQYVEVVNRYPEDEALVQEAAAYALEHQRQPQLAGYYRKTAADSPRDFRWPMVLARLQTHFEDFPAAIEAWTRASEIRPERAEFYSARARLEERLMRFEEAAATYSTLYERTYRNPQWMEKIAEVRARQGQTDAAVQALQRALVEGRPQRPDIYFRVAGKLESWNMLDQARQFAERGLDLAGKDLLVDQDYVPGARTYGAIMTRLRRHEDAFKRLRTAARDSGAEHAREGLRTALQQMGAVAERYFTPEEKSSLADFLGRERSAAGAEEVTQVFIPLAESAGLSDLEVRWRLEQMTLQPERPESVFHMNRLIDLQERRMKFEELAAQIEQYWRSYPEKEDKDSILDRAAAAYRHAGNTPAEIRVLSLRFQRSGLPGNLQERLFELLLAGDTTRLISIAQSGRSSGLRNSAADFAVANSSPEIALRAVAACGQSLPPVWSKVYTGLVGLHYRVPTPEIHEAFLTALGKGAVGDRIGKSVDRNQQLAGDLWFYYGTRYGEFLRLTGQGNPEDYLPAELEHTPGRAAAYFALAEYYETDKDLDKALADFANTLELDPLRGDAHDRMARILWRQGKPEDAKQHWKAALEAFARVQGQRVPESFWENVRVTLENIGRAQLTNQLRQEADKLLRTYVRRNGSYRVEPLLQGALAASADTPSGVAWILDLARAAPNETELLGSIVSAQWIPKQYREPIFRRIVEAAREQLARARGEARGYAQQTVQQWLIQWIAYLLEVKQPRRAREALDALTPETRQALTSEIAPLEIRVAAQENALDALIELYRREPERTPPLQLLRQAGAVLQSEGDAASARHVLEFVYTRELEQQNLIPANFLALAEIRLETGDAAAALVLLRRMVLVAGEPFENLEQAADLLEKKGRRKEAAEFLGARARAVPWDAPVRERLAEAQIDPRSIQESVSALVSIAQAPAAPYETRVAAALALRRARPGPLKSASKEIDQLAESVKNPAAAEQPFFCQARFEAAKDAGDLAVRTRLLLGALAFKPDASAARLALFDAALEAGAPQLAVSCMKPLLGGNSRYLWDRMDTLAPVQEGLNEGEDHAVEGLLTGSPLNQEARKRVALGLAESLLKLKRPHLAALFFRLALRLETSKAQQEELSRRVEAVKTELARKAENARRRPVITENLEQDHRVRPRLED